MEVTVMRTNGLDPVLLYDLNKGVVNNPTLQEYFNENIQRFQQTVQQVQSHFTDTVHNIYNYFNNNEIINRAKNILVNTGSIIKDDLVQNLSYENIPRAGLLMRQYIMATPDIFHMYQKQRCHGYDGIWDQTEMNIPAEWRDDYLHSIDGILDIREEYADVKHVSTEFDNPLKVSDRVIISLVRDRIERLLDEGIDPTDPEKNKL